MPLPSITTIVSAHSLKNIPDGFKSVLVTPPVKKATLPLDDKKNNHPIAALNYIPRRKSGIYWIQVRRAVAAAVEISLCTR